MKMLERYRRLMTVLISGAVTFVVFAASAKTKRNVDNKSAAELSPAIEADEKSFAEIFRANVEKSQAKLADARKPYDMEFAISSNSLSPSEITNDYYLVDLSADPAALTMIRFGVSAEAFQWANVFIAPTGTIAYAFREGSVSALGKRGGVYRDVVRLQWAPIQVGTRVGYRVPSWNSSFQVKGGLSYEWVSLTGNLDGLNQSSWLSSCQISFGGTFFESDRLDLNSWFGGLTVSAGTTSSFGSGLNATFLEAGVRILL